MVKENCGVVGIFSLDGSNVIPMVIDALRALQHRGQEAWGIAIPNKEEPGVYISRLLDLMGVFFLMRFTKKPLRFFGMLGSIFVSTGMLILFVVVIQRYIGHIALANRPILLLGSLLLVLGVQLFALGLIGELIIFTHAGELKEYAVAETVNIHDDDSDEINSTIQEE